MTPKKVAIVDGYSTGRFYAPKLKAQNVDCVHVQSEVEINPFDVASFRPDDYLKNIVNTSLSETSAALRKEGIDAIVSGSESGVILTDTLAMELGLPGNDYALTIARRDKQKMQDALKMAEVQGPFSLEVASKAQFLQEFPHDLTNKYVVKPKDAAGSDGVHICNTTQEVESAIGTLLGQMNCMGSVNDTVLVQEFLEGAQYIVNTVSARGRHAVAEIWLDQRVEVAHGIAYSHEQLLPLNGSTQDILSEYALSVVQALGIKEGPAHHEIILTKTGPKLVEVGCRPQGSIDPFVIEKAIGYSHVSLTVDTVINPDVLSENLKFMQEPSLVRCVSLISHKTGRVSETRNLAKVCRLKSFATVHNIAKIGDDIHVTVDIATSPGVFYLAHPNIAQLESDYQEIRQIEKNEGFFTIEEDAVTDGVYA